jgi:hypothetical protein
MTKSERSNFEAAVKVGEKQAEKVLEHLERRKKSRAKHTNADRKPAR